MRAKPRAAPLALGEVLVAAAPHRVHEVVGHVHALAGAAEAVRVEHVALVQLEAGRLEIRRAAAVAHEPAHLVAALGQQAGEAAAHESGCSADERSHRMRYGGAYAFSS